MNEVTPRQFEPTTPEQSGTDQLAVEIETALMDFVAEQSGYGQASQEAAETSIATAMKLLREGKPKLAERLLTQQIDIIATDLLRPNLKEDRAAKLREKESKYKDLLRQLQAM